MTMMRSLALAATLSFLSYSAFAFHSDMVLQETRTLSLNAVDIAQLKVEAGAGSLNIVGAQSDTIEVTAEIYQVKAHSDYCLSLDSNARGALLKAGNCDDRRHYGRDMQTAINLTVSLPQSMSVNVADGSGALDIQNVAKAEIHDGSGAIFVSNIGGDLIIHDGSGSIDVSDVGGNVNVHDGSGPIIIKNIEQNVAVTDGSSSIEIVNVNGEVSVSDGSGGINVDGAKSFKLISDGSGKVNVTNVTGSVSM